VQERRRWMSDILHDAANAIAQRQGEQINRLTLVSLIFLPVTAVTGFFGMKFRWMTTALQSEAAFFVFPYVPTFAQPIKNPVYTIDDPAFVKSDAPVPATMSGYSSVGFPMIGEPLIEVTTSPASLPALAAGPPGSGWPKIAP
jgi:hypothetical protein